MHMKRPLMIAGALMLSCATLSGCANFQFAKTQHRIERYSLDTICIRFDRPPVQLDEMTIQYMERHDELAWEDIRHVNVWWASTCLEDYMAATPAATAAPQTGPVSGPEKGLYHANQ